MVSVQPFSTSSCGQRLGECPDETYELVAELSYWALQPSEPHRYRGTHLPGPRGRLVGTGSLEP